MKESGFTLIEILVTIIIFSIVGLIASQSLISLLHGAANAEKSKEIKQNGEYAIGVLEQRIRNAKQVTSGCDGSVSSSIAIINPDATTTTFNCNIDQIVETSGTAHNMTNDSVEVTSGTCSQVFTCIQDSSGNPSEIRISFTLEPAGQTNPNETFTSHITLRNK